MLRNSKIIKIIFIGTKIYDKYLISFTWEQSFFLRICPFTLLKITGSAFDWGKPELLLALFASLSLFLLRELPSFLLSLFLFPSSFSFPFCFSLSIFSFITFSWGSPFNFIVLIFFSFFDF